MAGTWQRLAHVALSGSGDALDSGTFTARKKMRVIIHTIATGGATNHAIRYNTDSGSNYAYRRNADGGSDSAEGSQTSDPSISGSISSSAGNTYAVGNITNISDKEKLAIWQTTFSNTAGAGNAPMRREGVTKWANTSAQITKITVTNDSAGSYDTGSYITVFGASDDIVTDEKTTLTNVPTNSRYEEIDTRKIYRKNENYTAVTYSTDFSSNTGWTEVGTGNITIDQSNSRLQYNPDHSGDDDAVVYDLQTTLGSGNNASDTAWVLRYKFNMSGSNVPSQYMMPMLSSASVAGSSNTTIDALGMWFGETSGGTGGAYANIRLSDGETSQGGSYHGNSSSAFSNSTDYYITMKRESATKFTIEIRTGSHTGSHALGSPISATDIPSSVGGLRYICFRDNDGSTHTRYLNSYIYDLEFYNGATSVDTVQWKERGSA